MGTSTKVKPVKTDDLVGMQALIAAGEGRASARCTKATDVARIVNQAERRLGALPKKLWQGTVVVHIEEAPRANAYGYRAEATRIVLRRRSGDWVLVAAERVEVRLKQPERLDVVVPAGIPQYDMVRYLFAACGLRPHYDDDGFDPDGFDRGGYNRGGFDRDGVHRDTGTAFDQDGFGPDGFDAEGYDRCGDDAEGYDRRGWSRYGVHRDTGTAFNPDGIDVRGFDAEGRIRAF